jgi:DNA helicase-2/ATP-dependent DNA helicase PcrA
MIRVDDPLLADLNPPQREAVTHGEGPLLVLAGAGSGKTQVLTRRIAWLVERAGVDPGAILALTFTNKAAREMEGRVAKLLGEGARRAWIGTFHSIALRILRSHADKTALGGPFTVYDGDDQVRLAKQVAAELNLDPKRYRPAALLTGVQRAKDEGRGVEEFKAQPGNPYAETLRKFFLLYQKRLLQARAMDFGDLLLETLRLFHARPEVAAQYARRFRHVLIDEYQDTNRVQYRLARSFSEVWGNLCVVGDDDQAIYGWRGADLRNILDFEEAFPGTRIVKLEQNYRSTGPILRAASSVISRNLGRHAKTLWTAREGGESVRIHTAPTEEEEAAWIVAEAKRLRAEGRRYGDMAVLYRAHALSRPLEEALLGERVAYAVFGGLRFYERKEVKDTLAYLRLVVHPDDPVAFRRIVNVPPRGVGDRTVEELFALTERWDVGVWEAARRAVEEGVVAARAARAVAAFLSLVEGWRRVASELSVFRLLDRILDESGYREWLRRDDGEKAVDRLENLSELLNAAEAFERESGGGYAEFLDRAALVSDQDRSGEGWDGLTLMTVHSAKGLEFDCVFLAGMEEGVFPHILSSDTPEGIEEERRLCYVAMTRARDRLYLTRSRVRRVYGSESILRGPSRFLSELDPSALAVERVREVLPAARNRPSTETPKLPPNGSEDEGSWILPEPDQCAYVVGMRVRHGKYGQGVVGTVEGRGPNARVTVDFGGAGRKKFVAGMAGLEIYR